MNDNMITLDREFVLGLVCVSTAVAKIARFEPGILDLIDLTVPSGEELDSIMEQVMEEFGE